MPGALVLAGALARGPVVHADLSSLTHDAERNALTLREVPKSRPEPVMQQIEIHSIPLGPMNTRWNHQLEVIMKKEQEKPELRFGPTKSCFKCLTPDITVQMVKLPAGGKALLCRSCRIKLGLEMAEAK